MAQLSAPAVIWSAERLPCTRQCKNDVVSLRGQSVAATKITTSIWLIKAIKIIVSAGPEPESAEVAADY